MDDYNKKVKLTNEIKNNTTEIDEYSKLLKNYPKTIEKMKIKGNIDDLKSNVMNLKKEVSLLENKISTALENNEKYDLEKMLSHIEQLTLELDKYKSNYNFAVVIHKKLKVHILGM